MFPLMLQSIWSVFSFIFNCFLLTIISESKCIESNEFHVYWNVPTFQCRSHRIFFNLSENYKIIQNENDDFRGDKISILYDPGYFPALLKNGSNSKLYFRNGGIPQDGNLTEHLQMFNDQLQQLIPNFENNGLIIIDFESWRPIFRQNFGTLQPYRDESIAKERRKHPFWSDKSILSLATYEFERAGRAFMESTLNLAKQARPCAVWGYYAYPYCFNMNNGKLNPNCPNPVPAENDKTSWLFESSDVFYPSLYLGQNRLNAEERQELIRGRIHETQRIAKNVHGNKLIIPYFWYKYQDTGKFLTEIDLQQSLIQLKKSNVNGLIIWGSSNDVNTRTKCENLQKYVQKTLGPIINEICNS